jgi:hypothetical protein
MNRWVSNDEVESDESIKTIEARKLEGNGSQGMRSGILLDGTAFAD